MKEFTSEERQNKFDNSEKVAVLLSFYFPISNLSRLPKSCYIIKENKNATVRKMNEKRQKIQSNPKIGKQTQTNWIESLCQDIERCLSR